jgi:putative nucleotidyltransferase-like protein
VRANELRNRVLVEELLRLLDLFAARGIPIVAYKGPTLATLAYGDPSLRQFGDLDLMVQEPQALAATELIEGLGYRRDLHRLTPAQETAHLGSHNEYEFVGQDGLVRVDLHWRATPRRFPFRLDARRLWSRLEGVSLAGRDVQTFSVENLVLLLCMHGAKDRWRRLAWLCDIDRLIRSRKSIDWEAVAAEARAAHGERMLRLGLFLAVDLLGTPLPGGVLEAARSTPGIEALARQVEGTIFGEAAPGSRFWDVLEMEWLHLAVCDRLSDRIAYLSRSLFTPGLSDWSRMKVPDPLFPLYHVLRPLRLSARCAREWLAPRAR